MGNMDTVMNGDATQKLIAPFSIGYCPNGSPNHQRFRSKTY